MATPMVAISLFLFDVAGLASHLRLEFGREIVWRLEIESVGYFFYGEVGRRQQFLGT